LQPDRRTSPETSVPGREGTEKLRACVNATIRDDGASASRPSTGLGTVVEPVDQIAGSPK
ncbi:MAG: hypothetical protein M0Z88_02830, partial [Actinomycetota bacterium]|nr:hypothetical protein [Actinomycetota bacterium]